MNKTHPFPQPLPTPQNLREEVQSAINRWSGENGSDTPDFILAEYLTDCLAAYDRAVIAREKWYGRHAGSRKEEQINEEHNASVERVIGKPIGWKDTYLNAAREAPRES